MNAPSLRHRLAEQDRVELRAQRGAVRTGHQKLTERRVGEGDHRMM